jgi:hypothetical protein
MTNAGKARRYTRGDLVSLFRGRSDGAALLEAIAAAEARVGLQGPDYDADQALAVLEELANAPGIIGVTARFSKARLLLRLARRE